MIVAFNLVKIFPDQDKTASKGWNVEHIAGTDGYLFAKANMKDEAKAYLNINGFDYHIGWMHAFNNPQGLCCFGIHVKKGDKFKAHGGYAAMQIWFQELK